MRLSIIFDNFGPYHVARVGALAGRIDVTGIELRARSKTYGWNDANEQGIQKVTLPEVAGHGSAARKELTHHLERALEASRPDVVAVNGWGDFMAPQSIRWCVMNGVPFVLMSESSALDGPRSAARDAMKSRLVSLAAAALVGGTPHREYAIALGLPEERVFTGYNAVDNDFFAGKTQEFKTLDAREEGRRQAPSSVVRGPSSNEESVTSSSTTYDPQSTIHKLPYFLASNRFIERKNLLRLIEAYARYAHRAQETGENEHPPSTIWPLVLLGDGEQKGALIAKSHELGLTVKECAPWERKQKADVPGAASISAFDFQLSAFSSPTVFFPGFRQIDELPRFYAHAGCFIHPALNEPWGLVVNEAMASGLPVLVSERCGCAQDLVNHGVNGFLFDPRKTDSLSQMMTQVASFDFPLAAFGEAGANLIKRYGPEAFAEGLQAAATKALQVGPAKVSLGDRLLLNLLCRAR